MRYGPFYLELNLDLDADMFFRLLKQHLGVQVIKVETLETEVGDNLPPLPEVPLSDG